MCVCVWVCGVCVCVGGGGVCVCVCGGGGVGVWGVWVRVCVYVHLHDKITVKRKVVFWWGRTVAIRGSNLKSWEDESRWLCGVGVCVCVCGGGHTLLGLTQNTTCPAIHQ